MWPDSRVQQGSPQSAPAWTAAPSAACGSLRGQLRERTPRPSLAGSQLPRTNFGLLGNSLRAVPLSYLFLARSELCWRCCRPAVVAQGLLPSSTCPRGSRNLRGRSAPWSRALPQLRAEQQLRVGGRPWGPTGQDREHEPAAAWPPRQAPTPASLCGQSVEPGPAQESGGQRGLPPAKPVGEVPGCRAARGAGGGWASPAPAG